MRKLPMKARVSYPLLAFGCFLVTVLIGWSPYGERINNVFYDLYFRQRGPQPPNESIVIVAIDDATLAQHGPLPLDRSLLAQGIRAVAAAQPSLIALDILLADARPGGSSLADFDLRRAIAGHSAEFSRGGPGGLPRPDTPESLRELSALNEFNALSRVPVVLATALEANGEGRWLNPRPEFALSAAAVGHAHADPDGDGVSRQVLLEKQGGGQRYWALALECFRAWLWSANQPITETDAGLEIESISGPVAIPAPRRDQRAMLVNYAGARNTFPQISFSSLGKDPSVAELLSGRIVLIGVTAQGSGDSLFTPFSTAGVPMPGVEIHANVLNTIVSAAYLNRVGETRELLAVFLIIFATLWALVRLQGVWQWIWLVGLAAFVLAAPYGRFLEGEVWPGFTLMTAFGTALLAGEAYQLLVTRKGFQESEQKRKFSQQRFEMAAHEMRTPLASIQASSELLANYPLDDARRGQMIQLLHEESQRLGRLVERFLTVERLSSGEMDLRREPVELTSLVASLVERLRPLADRKRVKLVEQDSTAPLEIAADPELLEFAVSNLVTNGVKYSPAGTQVCIGLAQDDQNAIIHVTDSGPGMSPEESRRVFDRFYRTPSADDSNSPGFGLGLAIAREIAVHHGGDIRVETSSGGGSRFAVRLPLSVAAENPRTVTR
jgi:signal transduction histidine kinase